MLDFVRNSYARIIQPRAAKRGGRGDSCPGARGSRGQTLFRSQASDTLVTKVSLAVQLRLSWTADKNFSYQIY